MSELLPVESKIQPVEQLQLTISRLSEELTDEYDSGRITDGGIPVIILTPGQMTEVIMKTAIELGKDGLMNPELRYGEEE